MCDDLLREEIRDLLKRCEAEDLKVIAVEALKEKLAETEPKAVQR